MPGLESLFYSILTGKDLDEAGERWAKRSSRSLYDDANPPEP